ncbi:flavodoxin domain-containing protein [Streptomyces sp.]|uniref:flavodoxin domain-containing protein n=1 Tax=Streptomyces sp. TaxID=1931 RepID=UPI002F427DF7
MTESRVLVVYGSTNGSTAEIARWIGETLSGEGIAVDVSSVDAVGDLAPYTAVVLGSAAYERRWLRDVVRFAHHHRGALVKVPVWLFSSGPLDASASERDIPPVSRAVKVAEELHVRGHMTFGGRLVDGAQGRIARMMLDQGKGGDFRDPGQIRGWALGIAAELASLPQPS